MTLKTKLPNWLGAIQEVEWRSIHKMKIDEIKTFPIEMANILKSVN